MEEELRRLIRKYTKYLYKVALLRLENPGDADEAVQDTFYKLSKYLFLFKGKEDEDIKRWMTKVLINRVKNYNRSFFRKHADKTIEEVSEKIISKESVESLLIIKEKIERLSDTYKDVVLMNYEGYTIKEISKNLKLTEDAVKKRLSRARKIIKEEEGIL